MRTLQLKAQSTNAVFATVNQMFGGSSQLPTMFRKGSEKMVKFNSDLSLYGPSSFTLLYPDRTEVKYLPGGHRAVYTATIQRGTWKVFQPNYPIPLQDNSYS